MKTFASAANGLLANRIRTVKTRSDDNTYWKEFEKTDVSHSAAHYLMAIGRLRKGFGYARGTDVAQLLGVTRGAASIAIAQLKKRELVAEDPHRFLLLTDMGERLANQIEQNSTILSRFMEVVLGVPSSVAHADACKMEHLLSLETGARLLWLMRSVLNDPERAKSFRDVMATFPTSPSEQETLIEKELP